MKAQIEYYVDSVFFTVRDHALRTARDLDVAWIIATGNYVVAMVASDAEVRLNQLVGVVGCLSCRFEYSPH